MVDFVYSFGGGIGHPDSLGREVSQRLRGQFTTRCHSLYNSHSIPGGNNHILLGSPLRAISNCFERSLRSRSWRRKVMLVPFCPGIDKYAVFLDECIDRVDLFLAITGKYWFDYTVKTKFSHWLPKMVHVDLAVNRNDFPHIKVGFNRAGRRRFLYIGHVMDYKNPEYFRALAEANPMLQFGHIGSGNIGSARVVEHGVFNFRDEANRRILGEYDFLLTVGRADANPTTILEAASWGLIPICTPESGYYAADWLVNVPLDNVPAASEVLQCLNDADEAALLFRQNAADRILASHFNWDRVYGQVQTAILGNITEAPKAGHDIDTERENCRRLRSMYHYHRKDRREYSLQRVQRAIGQPWQVVKRRVCRLLERGTR